MVSYRVLPAKEVPYNLLHQYVEINFRVYPDFTTNRTPKVLMKRFTENERIRLILALDGDRLVGWLQLTPIKDTSKHHFNMLVDDKDHGRGIGTRLLTEAKKLEDELRGVMVPIEGYKRRDGLPYRSPVEFYKKNGFVLTGESWIEYGDVEIVGMIWSRKSSES
ncbi:MAG: GNAT family N-acetyltransferase [Candidatus Kariarchaeaceae archaeon]|jgi:GNAT superfamily N-acetyltransferase